MSSKENIGIISATCTRSRELSKEEPLSGFAPRKRGKLEEDEERLIDMEAIERGLLDRRDELVARFNEKDRREAVRAFLRQKQAEALPGALAAVCRQYGKIPEGTKMPLDTISYERLSREDHVNYRLAALLSETLALEGVLENIGGRASMQQ
jgi:hypothetical protein